MKKHLLFLVTLLFAFAATAQQEHSIVIDGKSFRPIKTDALTGVNIDPIQRDSSRRPCARIKVRVNRMSKEDINGIEVKIITNNELTKCKTADYDNGLIIEMTAKPESRFYFYHPRLGYSNEVNINLEENKEYRLDAYLNQQLSISVVADIAGADVYLDEVFRGQTAADNSLVIHDVAPGDHKLRIEYADKRAEQAIYVSNNKLSFSQNVLTAATNTEIISKTDGSDYHYKVVTRKVHHYSDRRGGWDHSVCFGDIAKTYSWGTWWNYKEFNYTLGYRTQKNILWGLGLGIAYCNDNFNEISQFIAKINFPIFANMKVYMSRSRWQPYFLLSAGGRLSGKMAIPESSNKTKYGTSCLFAEPTFGIDFRMCNKASIFCQIAWIFDNSTIVTDTTKPEKKLTLGASFKLGFTF